MTSNTISFYSEAFNARTESFQQYVLRMATKTQIDSLNLPENTKVVAQSCRYHAYAKVNGSFLTEIANDMDTNIHCSCADTVFQAIQCAYMCIINDKRLKGEKKLPSMDRLYSILVVDANKHAILYFLSFDSHLYHFYFSNKEQRKSDDLTEFLKEATIGGLYNEHFFLYNNDLFIVREAGIFHQLIYGPMILMDSTDIPSKDYFYDYKHHWKKYFRPFLEKQYKHYLSPWWKIITDPNK